MRKLIITTLIAILFLTACSESPYSGYAANFSCDITFPPFNQVTSYGQFITVKRKSGTSYEATDAQGNTYTRELTEYEARQKFQYGLGGFIIGTPSLEEGEIFAYDWACPKCDMARYRLDIDDIGLATCHNCGSVYDLNSGGIPIEGNSRVLWRYRVFLNAGRLTIQN